MYEIGAATRNTYDPKLIKGLFGVVTLVKNSDINKFGYTGYGIGFDRGTTFSFPSGGFGHNALILVLTWVDQHTLIIKKGYISFRKRAYTRIWTHFNCRKVV